MIVGDDIAAAVLEFARAVNSTQIVVGASRHGRLAQLVRPSTSMAIVRGSGDIDVHVVTHDRASRPRRHRTWAMGPPAARAWAAAIMVPALLAVALLPWRDALTLSTVLLIFLLGVLATALIGGVAPAAASALIAGVAANYFYTPPTGSLTIAQPENLFAIVVFLIVGMTVASIVDRSRRRAVDAARGQTEAQLLASVATRFAEADDPVAAVLEQARVGFGMRSAVLAHADGTDEPSIVACTGQALTGQLPDGADVEISTADGWTLALYGRPLPAADRRLGEVIAAQAVLAVDRARLATEASSAERLRHSDAVRTAILAAVSHDLRTPLSTIKASVSSLRDTSVDFTEADRAELLHATDQAADQLDSLLANLLDLSRLQTGVLTPVRRPVSLDEVVHRALIGLPIVGIRDEVPDDLPLVDTDAGLLERVVANVVANAVQHSPSHRAVRLVAGTVWTDGVRRAQIRVVDHGPGVPENDRALMFAPFQRLGDVPRGAGVGLGLAVARGLAEAVDAGVEVEDTPGGGLTMIITVPLSEPPATNLPTEGASAGSAAEAEGGSVEISASRR